MTGQLPCTCQKPCVVELDMGCPAVVVGRNNETQLSPGPPQTTPPPLLLIQNLKHLGWSPLRCMRVGTKSPSHDEIATLFPQPPLQARWEKDDNNNNNNKDSNNNHNNNYQSSNLDNDPWYNHYYDPRLTYRAAESGGTEQMIEPKESLELEQSKIVGVRTPTSTTTTLTVSNHSTDSPLSAPEQYDQIRDWCLALSRIAQTVNTMLGLPSNIFLVEDEDGDGDNISHKDNKSSHLERLDLLRVFYYHAVTPPPPLPQNQQNQQESVITQPQTLGSSPHTDWGSWTVVWQDTVGGLETYCRKCQQWIPVATTASEDEDTSPPDKRAEDTWDCIIHVGDMSSLALGGASPWPNHEEDPNSETDNAEWPSPKHRVVSPSHHPRTSLVYFAYPPASCSMSKMQEAMAVSSSSKSTNNKMSSSSLSSSSTRRIRDRRLPLAEYYLLKDQSALSASTSGDDDAAASAQTVYDKLKSLTIRDAIHEKWKQVQRD